MSLLIAMPPLLAVFKEKIKKETPTISPSASSESMTWGRPVFKAPPLSVKLPQPSSSDFNSRSESKQRSSA
ncbi:MAG: hypothetical protein DVB35_00635 [Verrucomicrobia bacterium]|nr:MAG: hypothetical protein DVB35_00635 [Verrucomicrobiota bacterium]